MGNARPPSLEIGERLNPPVFSVRLVLHGRGSLVRFILKRAIPVGLRVPRYEETAFRGTIAPRFVLRGRGQNSHSTCRGCMQTLVMSVKSRTAQTAIIGLQLYQTTPKVIMKLTRNISGLGG